MNKININEKEIIKAKENGFMLAGKTGSGKSTLLNAIYGKNVSKVEKSSKSGTQESSLHYYQLKNGKNICIIDTPGLSDTQRTEKKDIDSNHIQGIIDLIIKEKIIIKGILFVLNFQNERIDSDEQRVMLIYNKLFPFKRFWKNIIIIYTHYYSDPNGDTKEEIINKRYESNKMIFERIIKSTQNSSDIIDYKDLCIRYFNSFYPVKNSIQENNNLKVKEQIEVILNEFYNKEPLFYEYQFLEVHKVLNDDSLNENEKEEKDIVIIEEILYKKSPWLHYNKRLVKFYSKGHIDYIDPYKNELKGSFFINSHCCANVIDDYKFEVVTLFRTFIFKHKTKKIASIWVEKINSFVDKFNEKIKK